MLLNNERDESIIDSPEVLEVALSLDCAMVVEGSVPLDILHMSSASLNLPLKAPRTMRSMSN